MGEREGGGGDLNKIGNKRAEMETRISTDFGSLSSSTRVHRFSIYVRPDRPKFIRRITAPEKSGYLAKGGFIWGTN